MKKAVCFVWIALAAVAAAVGGCEKPVHFPAEPASMPAGAQALRAYDAGGAGRTDFFMFARPDGRVDRIGYDTNGDGKPDTTIPLDEIPASRCRHLVLILDGFGYDAVKRFYDEGHLRVFHAPSKVVAPYPTLTDLGLEDALGYIPVRGMEAEYFNHRTNSLSGGSEAYMRGENQPYDRLFQYRADMLFDAIGYLKPWEVFGKEVNDVKRLFDLAKTQELIAYFVSSAGVGTTEGEAGQRRCLLRVEQLVNQVLWETRGLTKITIFADHGHSYTPSTRIGLEKYLTDKGWRIADSLQRPRDAVSIRFGLETYASFATREPAKLAADLAACPGVDLASYADGNAAVVLGAGGAKAMVRRKADRYSYERLAGDPLALAGALAKLKPDAEGFYDAREMLAATADGKYPAPLERLWRAHFAMVENPPDVIVSLEDRFYYGSESFAGAVKVASTHGSLNRSNSLTFIMSTAGVMSPLMESADIPGNSAACSDANGR